MPQIKSFQVDSTIITDEDLGVRVQDYNPEIVTVKNNLNASVAPTATDDSASSYEVGSRWIDTTANKEYVCLDASAAAAIWGETSNIGINDNADAVAMTITSSENIGVGETVPLGRFHIRTSDTGGIAHINHDELILENNGHAGMGILAGVTSQATVAFGDSADPNIGAIIYDNNVDAMSLITNNTINLLIDSSGNVGIGETVPLGKLHIKSSTAGGITVSTNADDFVVENGGAGVGMTLASASTGIGTINFIDEIGAGGSIIYNHPSNYLRISTAATEALRINSSQFVGIGTTNPLVKFVVSNAGAEGFEVLPGTGAGRTALQFYNRSDFTYDIARYTALSHEWQISASTEMTFNGSLGIGTSSPDFKLEVEGPLFGGVTTAAGYQTNNGLVMEYSTGGGLGRGVLSACAIGPNSRALELRSMSAGVPNDYQLNLHFDGSVGLNVQSPGQNLAGGTFDLNGEGTFHVKSTGVAAIIVEGTTNAQIDFIDLGGAANDKWFQGFVDNGVFTLRSLNDSSSVRKDNILVLDMGLGTVGIGEAVPQRNLHIDGNGAFAGMRIQGQGSGFTATSIEMICDSGSRGNGVVMFDDSTNINWYAGTAYSATDQFIIARDTTAGVVSSVVAQGSNALLTVRGTGKVGIGENTPLGQLHVKASDVGTIAPSSAADDLVLETSGSTGITIYSGNTSNGFLVFGDVDNDAIGQIQYNHNNNDLTFTVGGSARMTITTGVEVGAPTGGDKGAGTINCAADIYKNNSAYTNPDYVLEHYFTGSIVKFIDNTGAKEYKGMLSIDEMRTTIKDTYRLPGTSSAPSGVFERADFLLEKLEEAYLYITELHDRIEVLETTTTKYSDLEARLTKLEKE